MKMTQNPHSNTEVEIKVSQFAWICSIIEAKFGDDP